MPHILLVEDYRDTRDVAVLILRDAGYTVTSVSNGREALSLAELIIPDLILMDLALPGIDGWETTRCLKADPRTHHIPIIAFTANVLPEAHERALAAGCADIIAKPFDIDCFLHRIACYLNRVEPTLSHLWVKNMRVGEHYRNSPALS